MAQKLTSAEKAAVLLLAMGEELAAQILAGMPKAEAVKVATSLSRLGRVDESTAQQVLTDFSQQLAGAGGKKPLVGDAAAARRLFQAARPGADDLDDALGLAGSSLAETLAGFGAEDLARYLRNEHPQTIALALAHLAPKPCGEVLKLLPPALHVEVLLRVARLEAVDPGVLADLEDAVRDGIGRNASSAARKRGGPQPLAAMLAGLDEATRNAQLAQLEAQDPALAELVRSLLFVFADLAGLDDRGLQELLKTVAEPQLKLALKGADEALRERFFANMSQRRAQTLREDVLAMPKTKLSDVEAAQKELAALARRLMDEGKIADPRAAA